MSNAMVKQCRKSFFALISKRENLNNGSHILRVTEVLAIGRRGLRQPAVAVVRDGQGRILVIPEDTKGGSCKRLASRWNVRKNMQLFLTVDGGKISDVFIGD